MKYARKIWNFYSYTCIGIYFFYCDLTRSWIISKKKNKSRNKKIFKVCKYLTTSYNCGWCYFNVVSLKIPSQVMIDKTQ